MGIRGILRSFWTTKQKARTQDITDLAELAFKVSQLEMRLLVYQSDIMDLISKQLEPISKRNSSRLAREKQEVIPQIPEIGGHFDG